MYVLPDISVTAPTFQVERSPLKAPVLENTVHHRNKNAVKNAVKKRGKKAIDPH